MKVGVFTPEEADRHHDTVLKAFANGIMETGDECFVEHVERYKPCDVAVVFGVRKRAVALSRYRGDIIDLHKKLNKPVVVIDSGYVKRDRYYMVGLNGLNGRADFKNHSCPSDRWASLGVPLAPWREDGGHILVCGQLPWDAAVEHVNFQAWANETIERLKATTDKEIRFRQHPKMAAVPMRELAEDLANAHAVVTFNSNSGVDAAIAGVPVFAADEGSMAWPVANKSFSWIDAPIRPEREQWAHNLAYAQWTVDEMKEGKPWRHLMH